MSNAQILETKDQRYPFQVSVVVDPADYDRLSQHINSRRGLKVTMVDDEVGNEWTVAIGCASRRMAEDVQDWAM